MARVEYIGLFLYLKIISVYANFCEWDYCSSKEYCCGNNKCCSKSSDSFFWYLVIGLAIIVLFCIWTIMFTSLWIKLKNFVYVTLFKCYSSQKEGATYKDDLSV